jgi:hypothetical protein
MYGADREIDSCSIYGSLVRGSLLGDFLSESPRASFEEAGELLSTFARNSGVKVVIATRSVLVERFDIEFKDRTVVAPLNEQLRRRDRRSDSHVLVIGPCVEHLAGATGDDRIANLLRALVTSGRIVHLLPADADRTQPWTETFEREGIEVVDAPLGSSELLSLVEAVRGNLEFVLVTDPLVAVWWASFLLEHLGEVPLVCDAAAIDESDDRIVSMEARVARLADVVLDSDVFGESAPSVGQIIEAVNAVNERRN